MKEPNTMKYVSSSESLLFHPSEKCVTLQHDITKISNIFECMASKKSLYILVCLVLV